MAELYIYYRVHNLRQAAAKTKVLAMHALLAGQHPGLAARLLTRQDSSSTDPTWMEIYTHPQGIGEALREEIELAAQPLSGELAGPRRTEVFEPCV